ncbi:MAG: IPT/TIG domain-containing protein [Planctomycetes bacterium]|nr:IPT/TIG domain-containing protein [Planctomycetota bacterium]
MRSPIFRTRLSLLAAPTLLLLPAAVLCGAERINHAGRILGPEPVVTAPVLFNTPQADAIVAALQIMPRDNAWNEIVAGRPKDPGSDAMIAQIRADVLAMGSGRNTLRIFSEMNYVLVPPTLPPGQTPSQPLVGVRFVTYPDDSDFNGGTAPVATWPIPSIMPVESWPSARPAGESLDTWQRTVNSEDRHSIIVQPGAMPRLFETWQAVLTGNTPAWQASNGAIFRFDSNILRTDGLTSGDAAGLPLFPALIRYDECAVRGVIEHALRVVVARSRRAHIYPASHDAGSVAATATTYPAMGQRIRLRSDFTIPTTWTTESRAVATALKTYGGLVADNGGFLSVSACPDQRFASGCFDEVQTIDIGDFEVVLATGPTEGPRAANAPAADAGGDQTVQLAAGATLSGGASGTGLTTTWSLYDPASAPGTVAIAAPGALSTAVGFSAPGAYTLLLTAGDGTHTPAYDAVVVTVLADGSANPAPTLSAISPASWTAGGGAFTMTLSGTNLMSSATVSWAGQADLAPLTASSGSLTVAVPAGYVAAAGSPQIRVVNPTPGGGPSAAQTLVVAAPSGGSTTGGGATSGGGNGGGCGLGAGFAALATLLLFACRRSN